MKSLLLKFLHVCIIIIKCITGSNKPKYVLKMYYYDSNGNKTYLSKGNPMTLKVTQKVPVFAEATDAYGNNVPITDQVVFSSSNVALIQIVPIEANSAAVEPVGPVGVAKVFATAGPLVTEAEVVLEAGPIKDLKIVFGVPTDK